MDTSSILKWTKGVNHGRTARSRKGESGIKPSPVENISTVQLREEPPIFIWIVLGSFVFLAHEFATPLELD